MKRLLPLLLLLITATTAMAQYPLPATDVYGNLWVQDSTKAFNGLYQWDGSQWQPVKSLWDTVPVYAPLYGGLGFDFNRQDVRLVNDTLSIFGNTVAFSGAALDTAAEQYYNGIVASDDIGSQVFQQAVNSTSSTFIAMAPDIYFSQYSGVDTSASIVFNSQGINNTVALGTDERRSYYALTPESATLGVQTAQADTLSVLQLYQTGSSVNQLFDLQSNIPGQGGVGFESQIDFGHLRAKMYATSFDGSTNLSVVEVDTIGILLNADDFGMVVKVNANGLVLPNLPADPPTGENGAIYFNTVSNTVRIYIGGLWTGL